MLIQNWAYQSSEGIPPPVRISFPLIFGLQRICHHYLPRKISLLSEKKKAILSKMHVLKQNLHETLKMYIIWFDYLNKMCRIFFVEILLFHLLFINWPAISNYVYFKFVAFTYSNGCLIIFSCSNILLLVALESSKRIMGRPMIFRLTTKVRTASAHARREQWSIADL